MPSPANRATGAAVDGGERMGLTGTTEHMTQINKMIELNDGNRIPQLGLGVWQLNDQDTYTSCRTAITAGYRHIDTAMIYGNEDAVGRAVADAIEAGDVTREDLFITTKLWNSDQERASQAIDESLRKLGLDYVDLYLMHWPCPDHEKYVGAYEQLVEIQKSGKAKSVGVCNFYQEALDEIIEATGHTPAVNQIEIHPGFSQTVQRSDNARRGIVTESWSPLGQGQNLKEPAIANIAARHNVSTAQVIIAWHLKRGDVVIPRSSNPQRVEENFNVWDINLSEAEVEAINVMDRPDGRIGPDPKEFNAGTPAEKPES